MPMKSNHLYVICLLLFTILFFLYPDTCFSGAYNGIKLWLFTVIPSLLPFILVTNLILELQLLPILASWLYPIFRPLLGITPNGCFPALMGMLSGYPIGAKNCADLIKNKAISTKEGQYLLSFVNNPSPMFLTTYLASQCLNCSSFSHLFYFIILLSSLLCSIIYRIFILKEGFYPSFASYDATTSYTSEKVSIGRAMDQAITNGFETMIKIGGYVLFFSILASLLEYFCHCTPIKCICLALLEMTTGIHVLSLQSFSLQIKIILTLACASLGGLSSVCQTQSVIAGSGLSIKLYIKTKLIQTMLVLVGTSLFLLTQ